MKKYRILIFAILLAFIISISGIVTYAYYPYVEGQGFYIQSVEELFLYENSTWSTYIDNEASDKFTYDENYVYFDGNKLWRMPDNATYVKPSDKIYNTTYGLEDYQGFMIDGLGTFFCDLGEIWRTYVINSQREDINEPGFSCDDNYVYYEGKIISTSSSIDGAVKPTDSIIQASSYCLLCAEHDLTVYLGYDEKSYCYYEVCNTCGFQYVQAHDFVYDLHSVECVLCGYYYVEHYIEIVVEDNVYCFTFDELGIDEQLNSWSDVAATFNGEDLGEYLFSINESDVMYLYMNKYGDDIYHSKYTLNYKDGSLVYSSDSIQSGDIYYVTLAEETHNYVDMVGTDDATYCYYERCTICGTEIYQEHDYIVRSGEPSCEMDVIIEYECCNVGCGYIFEEELAKIPHTFNKGVVLSEPTCTEDGIREYTCEVCGYSYQTTISALGHDYNSFGNCRRADCSNNYFGFKPDFSWLTDWFSKGQGTIDEVVTNIEQWAENVGTEIEQWTDDVFGGDDITSEDPEDLIEEIKDLFNRAGQLIEKLLALIMGAVVGYIVVKCIPVVVAFFKGMFGINDKHK